MRALIVEDNRDVAGDVRKGLEEESCAVDRACGGAAVLRSSGVTARDDIAADSGLDGILRTTK
jgi:DNA-binding response OmpR family regulator